MGKIPDLLGMHQMMGEQAQRLGPVDLFCSTGLQGAG